MFLGGVPVALMSLKELWMLLSTLLFVAELLPVRALTRLLEQND
jgi:hypothetical protein